jgi:hypothetical protein
MHKYLFLFSFFYLMVQHTVAQSGVSISATPALAHPSAMLDITSTNRGFLAPRLTTTQRNGIASPADGLMLYDSTFKKYMYYNQADAAWKLLGSDTLQIPFRKTFTISSGGGSGYTPSAALFSLKNSGTNAAAYFGLKQLGNTRGNAMYAEYDGNNLLSGYNSAIAVYGMKGRYTTGLSAYSDSTAGIDAYNIYRGTAIMAQNSVNFGGGPFAGIASAIFNSNKTLEGYACGIYQGGIESSPIIFNFQNAAIVGYSEAGAGGKFYGTDTAIHALGNTYLMGNLRLSNGTQGDGKILRSDGVGNTTWAVNTKSDVLSVPATAFRALSGNSTSADYFLDASATSTFNDITITNTTTAASLVAEVQIPNGATINGITLYAYDNNATVGLKADLISTPNTGTANDIWYSAKTGAAFASNVFYNGFTGIGVPTVVNNALNSYLIKIYPVDAFNTNVNWATSLYIKAVVVSYSFSPL